MQAEWQVTTQQLEGPLVDRVACLLLVYATDVLVGLCKPELGVKRGNDVLQAGGLQPVLEAVDVDEAAFAVKFQRFNVSQSDVHL